MDPALRELIAQGRASDEVAVVVRFQDRAEPPASLRLRARFGSIATARVARGELARLHDDPAILSLKAPRVYARELETIHDPWLGIEDAEAPGEPEPDHRPPDLPETGRGTVVCAIDWGIDYAHPDLRRDDGSTRLLALWDQRAPGQSGPYGYGIVHDRQDIDRALGSADPFAALGYRPAERSHGTHVLGIAAGNGRAGGPVGVAPEADLVFVHMGSDGEDLGSSIELLEAIDFATHRAGDRPLAINLSLGRHAGPHDGTLLVERAIDWLLVNRPGTAVVQSTGNYYARDVHMRGRLREQRRAVLPIRVVPRKASPVSVEIWYKGADEFTTRTGGPDGAAASANLGHAEPVRLSDGRTVGMLYHRAADPNNGDNLVNLILHPAAPSGDWTIMIEGVDVVDGRWHAWIERDAACPGCQAQFPTDRADATSTTGSICNAMRTVAVGAYDAHDPTHALPPFSSVGPTRDGRRKPLLVAPGVRVMSLRSRRDAAAPPGYVSMSGTSMAAPHVTGTFALMLQAAGRQRVSVLRSALFASLVAAEPAEPRWGYGMLDIAAAVARARRIRSLPAPALATQVSNPHPREDRGFDEAAADGPPPPPAMEAPMTLDLADLADRLALGASPHGFGTELLGVGVDDLIRRALDPGQPSMTVIAWRGRRLSEPFARGDILVRQAASRRPLLAVLVDPVQLSLADTQRRGLIPEGPWPGSYVQTIEPGLGSHARFARRVAGPDGLMLADTSVLRRHAEPEDWATPVAARPTMRQGSHGPAVAELQYRLNQVHAQLLAIRQVGLSQCPLNIDGRFGPATQAATMTFQQLAFPSDWSAWDGVVGPRTWAALNRTALAAEADRVGPAQDLASEQATPLPCAADLSPRGLARRSADIAAGRRPRPQTVVDPATQRAQPFCPGRLDLSQTGPAGSTVDLLLWNFDIDGAYLKKQHEVALDRLIFELHAQIRAGHQPYVVHLSGFASRTGDAAHNTPLATDRETATEQYMRDHIDDATSLPELPIGPLVSYQANPSGFDMSSPPSAENPRARSVRVIAVPQGSPKPLPLVIPPHDLPTETTEQALRRLLTASMLLTANPAAPFTARALPGGPQRGTIWSYELSLAAKLSASSLTCKVAHTGGHVHAMPVLDHADWDDVTLDLRGRGRVALPLETQFLLGSFTATSGRITAGVHPIWRLGSTIDAGTAAVFAYDLSGPGAPIPLSSSAMIALGGEGKTWALVCCELVLCQALNDFEPLGALDAARIYPLIEILTNAEATVQGSVALIRPAASAMDHGWADGGRHKVGMFCDRNNNLGIMEALLGFLGGPGKPLPTWDNLFDYFDRDAAATAQTLVVVDPAKAGARFNPSSGSPASARLALDRSSETNLPTTVQKMPRQGAFDNIHLAPQMMVELPLPLIGGIPSKAVTMAPICAHDCFHIHWRWSQHFTATHSLGWGASGPYTQAGTPMVRPNQTVTVTTTPGVAGFTYRASADRQPANDWMVVMPHGAAYAVKLHISPADVAGRFLEQALALPAPVSIAVKAAIATSEERAFAWLYYLLQFWPALKSKPALRALEVLTPDLTILRPL